MVKYLFSGLYVLFLFTEPFCYLYSIHLFFLETNSRLDIIGPYVLRLKM
jgi:hypothetical protein